MISSKIITAFFLVTVFFLSCQVSNPSNPDNNGTSTFRVNYDGNGHTGGSVPTPQTKSPGIALTLSGNTGNLEKTGYTFVGWNTLSNGNGGDYSVGAIYTTDANITMYAKWTALPIYTITYDDNNSTAGNVPSTHTKTQGIAVTLAGNDNNLIKSGYTFMGWNTAANGSGTDYDVGASYTVDTSVTLYAKWTLNGTVVVSGPKIIDADGNIYTSIVIGTQVWTVENLRTTKYNDGTAIPHVTDNATWASLSTPAYSWYNNSTDTAYHQKWGALYNWYVVNPNNQKQIAPTGWRVPTDSDWTTLENFLVANGYNWDGTTTESKNGKALASTTDWTNFGTRGVVGNDISSNNSTGFTALPGGYRHYLGYFSTQYEYGYWWCAPEVNASRAQSRTLSYYREFLHVYSTIKQEGFSVRLVRDN